MKYALRDYQAKIIDDLRGAYAKGAKAPLLVSPTGSGKTVVFASITEKAAARGNRVMILVHRQELLSQCSEALFGLGVSHGVIAPGRAPDIVNSVQVASVQTLIRRLEKTIPPDIIIVDEGHHAVAGSWEKVIGRFPEAVLLGVTATPVRLDGKGLKKHFDYMVKGPTMRALIDAGFLSDFVIYAPPPKADISGVKKRFGDFASAGIAAAMDKPTITGDCIDHYMRICPGMPAMAFCASIAHAEHVAEAFNKAGIPSAAVDGKLPDAERRRRIMGLANGNLSILTSCNLISEGTDIPVVSAAILLRHTESLALYLQQCGRALRPYPGKEYAIILDHVGNVHRHGWPDEERDWTLTEGTKKGIEKNFGSKYWQCEYCFAYNRIADSTCWSCKKGRIIRNNAPDQVAGTLEVLASPREQYETYARMREKEALKRRIRYANTYEELVELGRLLGYNPKWAGIIWGQRKTKRREVAHGNA